MLFENFKVYSTVASLFSVLLWTIQSGSTLDLNAYCLTPKAEPGQCIQLNECPALAAIDNYLAKTQEDTQLLTLSRCGMLQEQSLVCCAVSNKESYIFPEPPYCGLQRKDSEGSGQSTTIFEFPWLAMIEYETPNKTFGFYCAGSLINDRYVLTAASCVHSLPKGWKIHRVRLGKWDLDSENDCQEGFCSNAPKDFEIKQIRMPITIDPSDNTPANDIALIRLNRQVHFSLTVQPICLPLPTTRGDLHHGGLPSYVSGWPKTVPGFVGKKEKVEMKVTSERDCKAIYNISLKRTKLCAHKALVNDTCIGGVGSPLMRKLNGAWYQIGVRGSGPMFCGMSDVPELVTKVFEYIFWMEDKMY